MTIQIGGFTPFTTIDYPGKLSAVLFLKGCPMRCPYCSNPHLIEVGLGEYDPDKILEWLNTRKGKLEAVVFSGGEALMQGDNLIEYIKLVKEMGFYIGLHSNGFYPEKLKKALEFVDWLGLDFKGTKNNFDRVTGISLGYDFLLKSLQVWLDSGKDGEVRTTCDPRFISKEDLLEIAKFLSSKGVKKYAVQKYIPHFEKEDNKTTETERNQFFSDIEYKNKINSLFESVSWRD